MCGEDLPEVVFDPAEATRVLVAELGSDTPENHHHAWNYGNALSKAATDVVVERTEIRRLPCVLTSAEQAQEVGRTLHAHQVVWGDVQCDGSDRCEVDITQTLIASPAPWDPFAADPIRVVRAVSDATFSDMPLASALPMGRATHAIASYVRGDYALARIELQASFSPQPGTDATFKRLTGIAALRSTLAEGNALWGTAGDAPRTRQQRIETMRTDALTMLEASVEACAPADAWCRSHGWAAVGWALTRLHRSAAAEAALTRARDLAKQAGDRAWSAELTARQAAVARLGRYDEPRAEDAPSVADLLDEAIALLEGIDSPELLASVLMARDLWFHDGELQHLPEAFAMLQSTDRWTWRASLAPLLSLDEATRRKEREDLVRSAQSRWRVGSVWHELALEHPDALDFEHAVTAGYRHTWSPQENRSELGRAGRAWYGLEATFVRNIAAELPSEEAEALYNRIARELVTGTDFSVEAWGPPIRPDNLDDVAAVRKHAELADLMEGLPAATHLVQASSHLAAIGEDALVIPLLTKAATGCEEGCLDAALELVRRLPGRECETQALLVELGMAELDARADPVLTYRRFKEGTEICPRRGARLLQGLGRAFVGVLRHAADAKDRGQDLDFDLEDALRHFDEAIGLEYRIDLSNHRAGLWFERRPETVHHGFAQSRSLEATVAPELYRLGLIERAAMVLTAGHMSGALVLPDGQIDGEALLFLAKIKLELKEYAQAAVAFRQAGPHLRDPVSCTEAFKGHAEALIALERIAEARAVLEGALNFARMQQEHEASFFEGALAALPTAAPDTPAAP